MPTPAELNSLILSTGETRKRLQASIVERDLIRSVDRLSFCPLGYSLRENPHSIQKKSQMVISQATGQRALLLSSQGKWSSLLFEEEGWEEESRYHDPLLELYLGRVPLICFLLNGNSVEDLFDYCYGFPTLNLVGRIILGDHLSWEVRHHNLYSTLRELQVVMVPVGPLPLVSYREIKISCQECGERTRRTVEFISYSTD